MCVSLIKYFRVTQLSFARCAIRLLENASYLQSKMSFMTDIGRRTSLSMLEFI